MKITKTDWALMPASIQALFKPSAENAEEYDNGEENAPTLKAALDRERAEKAENGRKLKEYQDGEAARIETARQEALKEARGKGDFATIEKDYKDRMEALKQEVESMKTEQAESLQTSAIDAAANELSQNFVSPSLAIPAIKARLKAEIVEGKALVRVLDKDGKPTSLGVSDLKNEFLTDTSLKASIVASKGGGGGATTLTPSGGAMGEGDKKFNPATAKGKDLVAHLRETDPELAAISQG